MVISCVSLFNGKYADNIEGVIECIKQETIHIIAETIVCGDIVVYICVGIIHTHAALQLMSKHSEHTSIGVCNFHNY
jgi:hypothetical protein